MSDELSWPSILGKLIAKIDLSPTEITWATENLMSATATPAQMAGFMIGMRSKGERVAEISAMVDVLLAHAVRPDLPNDALDIVGTGGDQLGTVNISSMAALVAAAAGVPVLKHGSRSASGRTGSSEMLEAAGIKLDLAGDRLRDIFGRVGMGFFFAPAHHPALKNVAAVRKELGVPTIFNFLGPLANPVQPLATALGVANEAMAPVLAEVMQAKGRTAFVFRGSDGLDELTTTGVSQIWLTTAGEIRQVSLDPADLGLAKAQISDLIGGDAGENATLAKTLFASGSADSPIAEIVALNAAAGMAVYELAKSGKKLSEFDYLESLRANLVSAKATIADGRAASKFDHWAIATNE